MPKYKLNLNTAPSRLDTHSAQFAKADARIAAARRVKNHLKILLSVPFVVSGLYFGSVFYNHVRVVPRGVETVQDFYRRYGNPPRVDTMHVDGRQYYRVTGEIPAPLGFPKGNPVYIFDSTGRLVDWVGESLNDPIFRAKWDEVPSESVNVPYFLEKFPPS